MNWKINSSKYLVKDRWLKLRSDSCMMPNGNIIEPYYVFEYPSWINVFGITTDQKVVLVKQYRHGMKKVVMELPSGCVEDDGESPLEAAKRELLEETGYTSDNFFQTSIVSANPANHNNQTYSFLATDLEKISDISLDEGEDVETVLLPFEEVLSMLKENKFHQSLHVSAIFYGLQFLKRHENFNFDNII